MKVVGPLLLAVIVILASVLLLYSWANYSTATKTCDVQSVSTRSMYLTNGGFEQGLQGWRDPLGRNTTALITSEYPHCGTHSLELVTRQSANSADVSLGQWLDLGQCTSSSGTAFGLKLDNGLTLSFWHRTPNATQTRFGLSVVFHNGSSKLEIDYLLAYRGVLENSSVNHDLSVGRVEVLLNSSSAIWQQSSLDLYKAFVKYFGVDPVTRDYCINYISLWQEPLGFTYFGAIPAANYRPASSSYAFFDDIDLYR